MVHTIRSRKRQWIGCRSLIRRQIAIHVPRNSRSDAYVYHSFLVDCILSYNAYEGPRASILKHFGGVGVLKAEQGKPDHSCGLYAKASYINHSCFSNTRRSFIGDVLILRATRNIAAGQELFCWYAAPKGDYSYNKTQEKLQNWGFRCSCEICNNDQETSNKKKKKRAALLEEFDIVGKNIMDEAGLVNIERLLDAIEQTYTMPAAIVPRLTLWGRYLALTSVYASIKAPTKTIMTAWKVLTALGFVVKRDVSSVTSLFEVEQWGVMVDPLIETWVFVWTSYERLVPRHSEVCE